MAARWLCGQGYVCWRDVSYLGRWIDLFAEHPDGRTAAVELKVLDWRRALSQAQIVRPSVELTFIGMWAPYVHRAQSPEASRALSARGIGVLAINGECEVVLEPQAGPARYARWIQRPARPSHRPPP